MPVVVQRQVQMVQTVLGGSAVAVQRQVYQHPCLDAEAESSGWPCREQVQFMHEVVDTPDTRVKETKAKQNKFSGDTLPA